MLTSPALRVAARDRPSVPCSKKAVVSNSFHLGCHLGKCESECGLGLRGAGERAPYTRYHHGPRPGYK